MLLFYTGEARERVGRPVRPGRRGPRPATREMLENLHRTKEIGLQSRDLLVAG